MSIPIRTSIIGESMTNQETSKLLVVDGLSVIRRVYEVTPDPESDPDKVINSCCQSLSRALYESNPTHAVLAIDAGGETWRHRQYPQYKANRLPSPSIIKDVMVPEICFQMADKGYASIIEPDVEADDVVATITRRWSEEIKTEVVVVSTDKDLAYLLKYPNVKIRNHFERTWRDLAWVNAKFKVTPELVSQSLALCGDTSDNIPGVPKVGPVGAAYILNKYGSIENAYLKGSSSENAAMKKLFENIELARLSLTLTTLKDDLDLSLRWDDCKL